MAIKSHQQGSLDGLCGPYSIINALRQLDGRRTPPWDETELFKVILSSFPKTLFPKLLWDGTTPNQLTKAAKQAALHLKAEHGYRVRVLRPFLRSQFDTARDFLNAAHRMTKDGPITFIGYIDWHRTPDEAHWSVFNEWSDGQLRLHDSDGMKPLSTRTLTLTDTREHRLCPKSTIALKLVSVDDEPVR
jgi:hypothetical protein